VCAIDSVAIGEAARDLVAEAGPLAGIRILAPVGTRVRAGEPIAQIAGARAAPPGLAQAFSVGPAPAAERPLIVAVIRDASAAPPSNPES
jgi:hypothetical protein